MPRRFRPTAAVDARVAGVGPPRRPRRLHRYEETSLKPAPSASPPWSTPDVTQVDHGNGTQGFGDGGLNGYRLWRVACHPGPCSCPSPEDQARRKATADMACSKRPGQGRKAVQFWLQLPRDVEDHPLRGRPLTCTMIGSGHC